MQIFCETVDLEEIARVDPGIAEVAAALGWGMGIKVSCSTARRCGSARPGLACWACWAWPVVDVASDRGISSLGSPRGCPAGCGACSATIPLNVPPKHSPSASLVLPVNDPFESSPMSSPPWTSLLQP